MKENVREQLRSQPLPDDELSAAEQQLLRQILDKDLEKRLAKALAEKGVLRVSRMRQLIPWLAAAVFLTACAVGWWLLESGKSDPVQMAATYLKEPLPLSGEIRSDNTADPERVNCLQAYQNGAYQQALTCITPLLPEARFDDHLLAGLCQVQLAHYPEAAAHLERALSLDTTQFQDEIYWRLALAYVMLGDTPKAKFALQKVINSDTSRDKDSAITLLNSLK